MKNLPALPGWDQPPVDEAVAIREIKAALRRRIAASGRSVEEVFDIVTAVIADVPYKPCAANVFRSAWIPAPPPESLPAMVRATFTRTHSGACRCKLAHDCRCHAAVR